MRWNILTTAVNRHAAIASIRRRATKHYPARNYQPRLEKLEWRLVPALTLPGPSTVILASSPLLGGDGALVRDTEGNLFGITDNGGAFNHGMVFELPKGSDAITVLASFDGANGAGPISLVEDSNGNLFGTTSEYDIGYGTVFEVQKGSSTITTLAAFDNTPHGAFPYGIVQDSSGNLFGVTRPGGGGYYNDGSVFELKKGSSTIINLAGFSGYNGYDPESKLVVDSSGNLFGTTYQGVPTYFSDDGYGTVFEIKNKTYPFPSEAVTSLAAFDMTNGAYPEANIVMDANGNLFGTTTQGGAFNNGTVFEVQKGSRAITTLANFDGSSGYSPAQFGLVMDNFGNLFGTRNGVFNNTGGTAFELPKGSNTINTLVTFGPSYWVSEFTPLVVDNTGNLFGIGGSFATSQGAVFELKPVFPNGTVNQPLYNHTLMATGGTGSVTFSVTRGSLPSGLTMSNAGVLAGTPTATGTFTFTVTGTDSAGASATQTYTVDINPSVSITTATLDNGCAGTPYSASIQATGGTGSLTFSSAAGGLPQGLTLSSSGILSGTPTVAGSYTFTITATDTVGVTANQTYSMVISPGPLAGYNVAVLGSSSVQAGNGSLVTVQAADAYGNPITNYSGPATVTATLAPAIAASNLPATVSINGTGLGFFLTTIQQAGSYTISVTDSSNTFTGASPSFTVVPGSAAKLAFVAQPQNSPTGVALPPVAVKVEDLYGNIVTTDNSDAVTISITSGPGSFTPGSTTTVPVHNGVATFSNLVLAVPGTYTLGEVVTASYIGPNSNAFSVAPLQVVPGSFAYSPAGFSLELNAPLLVNSVTPALYGSGFGAGARVNPTVSLTQTSGTPPAGNLLPYQVPGSLIVNTATNGLTFLETNTTSVVGNGTPILPDGTYVAHISSSGANGLQALYSGGGYLDGSNSGMPGNDFTATFTIGAAAAGDDVLWVPATADGPGQPLAAPGLNRAGGGYPVYLSDQTGKVTSVQATLTYNPALLTVTPTSNSTFSVTVPTAGTAVLHYSGPALVTGVQTPIGFVTATVPSGTAADPTAYRAKDLLHFLGVSLNGGATPATTSDGLHLVAYVGDADGNGAYSSNDAVLITRTLLSTDTGFAAYPLVDPVIVADTDGSGFMPADAALQANEAGVGFPTASLSVPPVPSGVFFLPIANNVDPKLSVVSSQLSVPGPQLSDNWQPTADNWVSVNIDDPHPAGSTGLIEAHLALTYDLRAFTVSAADIHAGSLLTGGDWSIVPTIDQATGRIAIALSSSTPITSSLGGSLVTIDFHPTGTISGPAPFELVASADPNGHYVATELEDAQGAYTLTMLTAASVVTLGTGGATDTPRVQLPLHSADDSAGRSDASVLESADRFIAANAFVDSSTSGAGVIPAGNVQDSGSNPDAPPETASLQVGAAAANTAAATIMMRVSLAPLTALALNAPLASVPTWSIAGWQHVAAQIFQALVRTSGNDPTLVSAVQAVDHSLAGQALPVQATSDSLDNPNWDEAGAALDWRPAPTQPVHHDPAALLTPALAQTACDATVLDQVFAHTADEEDVLTDGDYAKD